VNSGETTLVDDAGQHDSFVALLQQSL